MVVALKMKGRPITPHLALQKLANSAMPPTCMLAPEPSCIASITWRDWPSPLFGKIFTSSVGDLLFT